MGISVKMHDSVLGILRRKQQKLNKQTDRRRKKLQLEPEKEKSLNVLTLKWEIILSYSIREKNEDVFNKNADEGRR